MQFLINLCHHVAKPFTQSLFMSTFRQELISCLIQSFEPTGKYVIHSSLPPLIYSSLFKLHPSLIQAYSSSTSHLFKLHPHFYSSSTPHLFKVHPSFIQAPPLTYSSSPLTHLSSTPQMSYLPSQSDFVPCSVVWCLLSAVSRILIGLN